MLPETQDLPARLEEQGVGVGVAFSVALDLWAPVATVGSCSGSVLWASVPVAAVDEHGDLGACEDEVCSAVEAGEWTGIDAVSESEGVDGSSYGHLGLGVAAPVALHRRAGSRRRCPSLVARAHPASIVHLGLPIQVSVATDGMPT